MSIELHQSIASLMISKSPLHAWHKAFHAEPEYTEVTDTGTLAHALLLGGKEIVICDYPDWRTNASKAARDDARAAGKHPVLSHKLAEAELLSRKVQSELAARGLELTGVSELTVNWESPTGVRCQGRIDHWIEKTATIYDFKFCRSASKRTCENSFIEYGYDIQHAAYVQAVSTIYPHLAGRVKMLFIFVETEEPNAIRIMPVGATMRTSGEWRWGKACSVWADCLERFGINEQWPAYPDDGEPAECPGWALNQQILAEEAHDGGNL